MILSALKIQLLLDVDTIVVRCRWNNKWMMTIYCSASEGILAQTVVIKIKNTKSEIIITKLNYNDIIG